MSLKRTEIFPEVVDTKEAARYIGCSVALMHKLRATGGGPRFSRIGRRIVYRREILEAFLAENEYASTSDDGPKAA